MLVFFNNFHNFDVFASSGGQIVILLRRHYLRIYRVTESEDEEIYLTITCLSHCFEARQMGI